MHDLIIRNGLVFDGSGAAGQIADVAISAGRVVDVASDIEGDSRETIDAEGSWVMPGFLDTHTHYDAELLAAPGLTESVRHGVTTVVVGSCSLGTIYSAPEDSADQFSRVEALPREFVLNTLQQHQTWQTAAEYADAIDALPLGPNVAAFVGHSDLRVAEMGLGRATDHAIRPSKSEQAAMESRLEKALDAGFLGMSSMTNPWDKVGGDRFRSRRLPSTYATWGEYRKFHRILRDRDRILQSAPNITTKVNVLLFLAESAGFGLRKRLKTTLITAADTKSNPLLARAVTQGTRLFDWLFRGELRWQTVPMPFEVYADGIDLVVFEEFGAGEEALHLTELIERNELFSDPAFRLRFRADYEKKFGPRVWHRDFYDATIVATPDGAYNGRTFGEVADERGHHPVDTFLDLVIEYGTKLRWRTTIANHRPTELNRLMAHPSVHPSFADSGAHIRNMAFYNFPLHFLRAALRGEQAGNPHLSIAQAVHRLTGEIADWYGLDAGKLAKGCRADIAIVSPSALDDSLDGYHEAPMEGFGGLMRMVRRNDEALTATIIGGRVAYQNGSFARGLGETLGCGRFLRAHQDVAPRLERELQVAAQ